MVEAAVEKARSDLLSAGENVSVWKVSQSAALALQVSSWDSLGFRFSDIPCLRDLQFVEGKVNAFIHCFVTVRRMTSVYELGLEICKSEGVEENKEFSVEEFLDFLMQKYSVPARENLGVRIQSMGLYIKFIKGARRAESSSLSSIQERGLVTEQPKVVTYPIPNNLNSLFSLCDEYIGEKRKKLLIGIKLAIFNHASNGKIPAGNDVKPGRYGAAAYEIMKVLAMMLSTYRATDKQKRKMQRLFLQYPAVGLLNMAVRVLKGENIDVLLQPPDEPASINENSTSFVEQVKSESSSDSEPMSDDEKCVPSIENCVSPDFVIKKIGCYFQIDAAFRRKDLTLEKQLILRDCELWLKKQFSVDDFGCLGHGNLLDFLEKHSSALTSDVKYFLTGVFGDKPSIRVFMSQRHFLILLSQAARNFERASELTEKHVSILLRKQFPAIDLHMSDSGLGESLNLINEQSLYNASSFSLTFSASLLGIGRSSLSEGNFSSESALECLLRAPMLSDLQLWSHWDLVFGPSHGPLLDWLIDLGYAKGLSCIATADGRIIRVDHSVTLDGFLEAIAKGSSFQTAVNLLSLFHLYGGSKRFPLSLIRCYAQAGMDSIINSCTEKLQENAKEIFHEHKNSQHDQEMFCTSNDHGNAQCSPSNMRENTERNRIYEEVFWVSKAHATVSLFILNCLGYQPPEFRSFTAEILVTAFQFFTRDAK
ncbi:hypothetical protein HPP92_003883 [Vanilla planifolia]|uniref:Uncharacterized protein n=1 Tax=Vanilla planifolia TaxID=51239 RepID=A0A835VHM8_VANPL|nr:hypothetical protein HPP92_003883 [Vanilla planifolia]